MLQYRSTHRSSDCDETFTSYCNHAWGGFGNLRNLKTILAWVPGVALHSDLDEILHKCWWNFAHLTFQTRRKSLYSWPSHFPIPISWGTRCSNVIRDDYMCKCYTFINFSLVSFKITTNMRVHLQQDSSSSTFSKQLLDNGN